MNIGKLYEHPDWALFLLELQKVVDRSAASVVVAAKEGAIEDIRYRVGYHDAYRMLFEELKG